MKSKCLFAPFLFCLAVLISSCSAQNLKINVENNSNAPCSPQVFYWVNNDTGTEIKNLEWSLNGVYFYTADFAAENKTADGAAVSLSVSFGYKTDDKATFTEIMAQEDIIAVYLRQFIAQKSAADLSPKNDDTLKTEIRNAVNDEILSSSHIHAVRFNSLKTE